jgi:hypothetical protein
VVRIATHPEYQKMGYGRRREGKKVTYDCFDICFSTAASRALDMLRRYYQGEIQSLKEDDDAMEVKEGALIFPILYSCSSCSFSFLSHSFLILFSFFSHFKQRKPRMTLRLLPLSMKNFVRVAICHICYNN